MSKHLNIAIELISFVSKLSPFQSITVDGKNEFLKCFVLANGTKSWHVFG